MSTLEDGVPKPSAEKTQVRTGDGEVLSRLAIEKDKVVFQEGQESTDVFIIETGRIGIFKTVDGKSVPLAVLEKGSMFGEMAAFSHEKRSATAITLEPSVIARIPRGVVLKKIAACDPFIRALIEILIRNLGRTNERYVAKNQTHEKLLHELAAHSSHKS